MDDRDPEAFRALYRQHYAVVHRYLAARTPGDRADDLAAETFLVAWRRAAHIPPRHTLPWLLNVAAKVLANDRRSTERAAALASEVRIQPGADTAAPSSASDAERGTQRRALLLALDTLSPGDRELMLLHVWEDLPARDIARVLDLNIVATRARLSRARRRLQHALTHELAGEHPGAPEPARATVAHAVGGPRHHTNRSHS